MWRVFGDLVFGFYSQHFLTHSRDDLLIVVHDLLALALTLVSIYIKITFVLLPFFYIFLIIKLFPSFLFFFLFRRGAKIPFFAFCGLLMLTSFRHHLPPFSQKVIFLQYPRMRILGQEILLILHQLLNPILKLLFPLLYLHFYPVTFIKILLLKGLSLLYL